MAELALAVVGVVPILVRAITAFRSIQHGIKTAKRCVEHLDALAIDWKIQHGRFLNECVLLLMEGGEEEMTGRAMVKDPLHASWSKRSLGPSIEQCVGDSYQLCEKIIKRIEAISITMKKMMDCFDVVRSQKLKVSSEFGHLLDVVRVIFPSPCTNQQFVRASHRKWYFIDCVRVCGLPLIKMSLRSRSVSFGARMQTSSPYERKSVLSNVARCSIVVLSIINQCRIIITKCSRYQPKPTVLSSQASAARIRVMMSIMPWSLSTYNTSTV
jgi:hypothetical protein